MQPEQVDLVPGWAWLVVTKEGKLVVSSTQIKDNHNGYCKVKRNTDFRNRCFGNMRITKYQNKEVFSRFMECSKLDEVSKRYKAMQKIGTNQSSIRSKGSSDQHHGSFFLFDRDRVITRSVDRKSLGI